MSEEKYVWMGTPSQVINLSSYIWSILFCWLLIPLFNLLWNFLVIKNTKYELTTQRLKTRTGVINKFTDELELYRIQDYQMEQPLFLRLFGLYNIKLITSDHSNPEVIIKAVPNGEWLIDEIRKNVEECKFTKGLTMINIQ